MRSKAFATDPFDDRSPRYWRSYPNGVVARAVRQYLDNAELSDSDIATLREYLRQWIEAPVWKSEGLRALRRSVDAIRSRVGVERWLNAAYREGIDPL